MPHGPLSDEQKARMAEGRRLAAQRKREAKLAPPVDVEDVSLPTGYGSVVEPSEDTESPPSDSSDDPTDPYQIWLLTLDADTRSLFSDEELRSDFNELWRQVQEEKKKAKRKAARELGLSTVRSQLGLLPPQTVEALRVAQQNSKPVSMMIELPPALDNGDPPDVGLRINGEVIPHGKRWHGTYGEAASLREMLFRVGQHELRFKGVGLRAQHYLMSRQQGVNQLHVTERDLKR